MPIWQDAFGDANLVAKPYPGDADSDVIDDFLKTIGLLPNTIPIEKRVRANSAISVNVANQLSALIVEMRRKGPPQDDEEVRERAKELMSIPGERFQLPPETLDKAAELGAPHVDYLRRVFWLNHSSSAKST